MAAQTPLHMDEYGRRAACRPRRMPRVTWRWCFAQLPVVLLERIRPRSLRKLLNKPTSRGSIVLILAWQNLHTFFLAGRRSRRA